MNGRCDNDPLDVADDICDLCGGEFCTTCVIWPRGQNKPPVCKTCALNNSGLRGTSKTDRKASRRDAKKRREHLQETRHERVDGKFKFFDESEDFELPTDLFTGSVQATVEAPNRRRISLGRKKHQEAEGEPRNDQAEIDSSWEQDVTDRAPGNGARAQTKPVADLDADPFASDAESAAALATEAMVQSKIHDDALEDAEILASLAEASTATALIERLRSDSQLPPPPTYPANTNESGFAFPQTVQSEEPVFAPGALDFAQAAFASDAFDSQVDPFSQGPLRGDPFGTSSSAFEIDPFAPVPPAASPAARPLGAPPSLQTTSDDPFGPAAAPAVSGPPPPPPPRPRPPAPAPAPAPRSVQQPELTPNPSPDRVVPTPAKVVSVGGSPTSADVDANGNWIPPLLRGMAPKAERELETLPRRTSRVIEDESIPAALRGVSS